MPVILPLDKKKSSVKLVIALMYLLLSLGALTMLYPFLVTVCCSFANGMDYGRFSAFPRSLFSREDRFVKGIFNYFNDTVPDIFFHERPEGWTTWSIIGTDIEGIDKFARGRLAVADNPRELARYRKIAADYASFNLDYDIEDSLCNYDFRSIAAYLKRKYSEQVLENDPVLARAFGKELREKALDALKNRWGIPYKSFFDINMDAEMSYPMHHVTWIQPASEKAADFNGLKDAYRKLAFRPGAESAWKKKLGKKSAGGPQAPSATWPLSKSDAEIWGLFKQFVGETSPASQTYPYPMKKQWLKHLNRSDLKSELKLPPGKPFSVEDYNRLFGGSYNRIPDIPFPVPNGSNPALQKIWKSFVGKTYPRRLVELNVNSQLAKEYQDSLSSNFRSIANYNKLMKTDYKDFSEIRLPARAPKGAAAEPWMNFAKTLPLESMRLMSAEAAYQAFLLATYGSLGGVNQAYGWNLSMIEEAGLPFAEAYTVTFINNEWRYYLYDIASNYQIVMDFLFIRGYAFMNTVILVVLSILCTLTVNPLAAYALSRYRLKLTEQILLFLMGTMAFPAIVSSIPGFLLMRDLGLLNTYAALVLPGIANGLAIFILKGFFDGIPRELYEAATIDGANEWQIFRIITLPMTKPILAVNSLGAFIAAYNSWEWALLVCQRSDYWTIAVWIYQLNLTWPGNRAVVMAAFVIASIPTAIVFITCQKIILRGIVLPSMK